MTWARGGSKNENSQSTPKGIRPAIEAQWLGPIVHYHPEGIAESDARFPKSDAQPMAAGLQTPQ